MRILFIIFTFSCFLATAQKGKSFRWVKVTTVEMNAFNVSDPTVAREVFNTDTNTKHIYFGGQWNDLGSGVGTGDFLADGSVPMTGTLQMGSNGISSSGVFDFLSGTVNDQFTVGLIQLGNGSTGGDKSIFFDDGAGNNNQLYIDVSDSNKLKYFNAETSTTTDLTLTGGGSGDSWSDPVDSNIISDGDGTRDFGNISNRFGAMFGYNFDFNTGTWGDATQATNLVNLRTSGGNVALDWNGLRMNYGGNEIAYTSDISNGKTYVPITTDNATIPVNATINAVVTTDGGDFTTNIPNNLPIGLPIRLQAGIGNTITYERADVATKFYIDAETLTLPVADASGFVLEAGRTAMIERTSTNEIRVWCADCMAVSSMPNQFIGKASSEDSPTSTDITGWISTGGATITLNTTDVRSGTSALTLTDDNGGDGLGGFARFDMAANLAGATAGQTVTVTGYFKTNADTQFQPRWLNSDTGNGANYQTGNGAYQMFSITTTSDGLTSLFQPYANGPSPVHLDDIKITYQ